MIRLGTGTDTSGFRPMFPCLDDLIICTRPEPKCIGVKRDVRSYLGRSIGSLSSPGNLRSGSVTRRAVLLACSKGLFNRAPHYIKCKIAAKFTIELAVIFPPHETLSTVPGKGNTGGAINLEINRSY